MIKKLLISIVLFVLLIGGVAYFYLDSLVTSGIQVVGSQVLGTQVTVDSASISPLTGSGSINGLRIENPEGFNSQYAFELEEVSVSLNVGSVFSDVVEVDSVVIRDPEITYERRLTSDNIGALIDNLPGSGSEAAEQSEATESSSQLIIREFLMESPQLNLVAASIEAPIPLPDISLSNIGEENDASVAQAMRQILGAISTSILNSDPPVLDMLRENVENRIQEGVEEVEDAVEDITDRVRSIFN
ncbi:MAG: hypothetical protein MI746_09105 [Pseudomonadales bacterium]|nr:hypothetical protein [Pseudomonadales bacterium]